MNRNSFVLVYLLIPFAAHAQSSVDWTAPLPPAPAWDGKSQALIVDADDPWITPSERTGLTATPSYAETVAWLKKLAAATPEVLLISIGTSYEQRDLWMVIVSTEKVSTPAALKSTGKPTENAYIESFNGRVRQECLNQHWFTTMDEVQRILDIWRVNYNLERPHSSLGNQSPLEFASSSCKNGKPVNTLNALELTI